MQEYTTATEPKSSQLPLSQQEKAIAELNEVVNSLSTRLSPILKPPYPQSDQAKSEPDSPEISPLNAQLLANNRGVRVAISALKDIIDRAEV